VGGGEQGRFGGRGDITGETYHSRHIIPWNSCFSLKIESK